MSCVCHAFTSVHCCLLCTCLERADLLTLVCDANCIFITFPCDILGQVWYLIVSIPDFCRLSYRLSSKGHNLYYSLTAIFCILLPYVYITFDYYKKNAYDDFEHT